MLSASAHLLLSLSLIYSQLAIYSLKLAVINIVAARGQRERELYVFVTAKLPESRPRSCIIPCFYKSLACSLSAHLHTILRFFAVDSERNAYASFLRTRIFLFQLFDIVIFGLRERMIYFFWHVTTRGWILESCINRQLFLGNFL